MAVIENKKQLNQQFLKYRDYYVKGKFKYVGKFI